MKQVDGLKKNCISPEAQNLLGPRPIRPISGLRIQDSVQLLQEQLHDSVIFYEPCFAKNRANPHVYVSMFVLALLYITYKFDKCMTTDYIRFNKNRLQKHLSGDCFWVQRQQGRWKVQCCLLCLCKAFLYTESPLLNGIWSSKIVHTHHTSAKQFKTTDLPPPVGPTIIVECLDNTKAFWVRKSNHARYYK